jgi:hypothetical protein
MGGLLPQEEWVTTAKISQKPATLWLPYLFFLIRLTGCGAAPLSLFRI